MIDEWRQRVRNLSPSVVGLARRAQHLTALKKQLLKNFVFFAFFFVAFVVKIAFSVFFLAGFVVKKCGLCGKSLLLVKRNIPLAAHDASAFQLAISCGPSSVHPLTPGYKTVTPTG